MLLLGTTNGKASRTRSSLRGWRPPRWHQMLFSRMSFFLALDRQFYRLDTSSRQRDRITFTHSSTFYHSTDACANCEPLTEPIVATNLSSRFTRPAFLVNLPEALPGTTCDPTGKEDKVHVGTVPVRSIEPTYSRPACTACTCTVLYCTVLHRTALQPHLTPHEPCVLRTSQRSRASGPPCRASE